MYINHNTLFTIMTEYENDDIHKDDLPLLANVDDIFVTHYVLNLKCCFENKCFSGTLVVFLKPAKQLNMCKCKTKQNNNTNVQMQNSKTDCHVYLDHNYTSLPPCSKQESLVQEPLQAVPTKSIEEEQTLLYFRFILDTCDIIVENVEELSIDEHCKLSQLDAFGGYCSKYNGAIGKTLQFTVDKWSIQIWKEGICCPRHFPSIVRIHYRTTPVGSSLLWVRDQDLRPCVFTYGAWINNRSLFPCQEAPIAMATWEAVISVDEEAAVVLMSGDKTVVKQKCKCGSFHHYYKTDMVLPLSTLALAVGFWQGEDACENKLDLQCNNILCKIYAAPSLISKAEKELSPLVYKFVRSAEVLLTTYPFPRLDILIVPRCFGSLGMASPNIIFLSQSVLCGDGSMSIRLAHEIAHTWFGLLIGAYDWTEEWISEGFATFLEDKIYCLTATGLGNLSEELFELRSYIRWKMLKAEASNTEEELQILRPTQGRESTKEEINGSVVTFLKNGQKDDMKFIQIHYLKGYFLLCYLSNIVGEKRFMDFLSQYVTHFKGKLVLSKEFLEFYWKSFPELKENSITVEDIISEWLDKGGLPHALSDYTPSRSNLLYTNMLQEANKWIHLNNAFTKAKKRKGIKIKIQDIEFKKLLSEQIVLLLEILLEESMLTHQLLKKLSIVYEFDSKNADILHRWCELVVKHRYKPGYYAVKNFLVEHQAMGVYLFGELMISNLPSHRKIAHECFAEIQHEMEPPSRKVVMEMLGINIA